MFLFVWITMVPNHLLHELQSHLKKGAQFLEKKVFIFYGSS